MQHVELPVVWLPEIIETIARHLDDNDVACSLRLLDKATARLFAQRVRVRLSHPVPYYAFHNHWAKSSAMRTFSFIDRLKLLALTAASGCLPNFEVAVQHAGYDLTCRPWLVSTNDNVAAIDPLATAASSGHIHVCEWLLQNGCCPRNFRYLDAAAQAGRQEACAWLLDHGSPWDKTAVYAAAEGGHLALMDWLLARRPSKASAPPATELLEAAAEGCDLAALQRLYGEWLRSQVSEGPQQPPQQPTVPNAAHILGKAARSCTPDWGAKVAWLESQGFPRAASACTAAASCPDAVDRLQWLQARGYPVYLEGAVTEAAVVGNIAALQHLLPLDGPGIDRTWNFHSSRAARHGQLAVLKLLHAQGLLNNPLQCEGCLHESLRYGQLEVVMWLVEEAGVTLHTLGEYVSTPNPFLLSGMYKMELLQWVHARGCRLTEERAVQFAAATGREDVVEWLLAHGYRFPDDGAPYHGAIMQGDLGMLRCLWRLGCPWGLGIRNWKVKPPRGVRAWLNEVGLS